MSSRKSFVSVLIVALLLAGAGFAWLHFRGGSSQAVTNFTPIASSAEQPTAAEPAKAGTPPEGKEVSKAPIVPPAYSPTPGETLNFSASFAKVNNVATLQIEVVGEKEMQGKAAWHLKAGAQTQNPLKMVFPLDDRFESYSDANSFTGLRYEMHLNERGVKVESIQQLTPTAKEPAPIGVTQARVLPGTRDPLGFLQYLRSLDWSHPREVRGPVYDGHKLYDVRAKLTGNAEVKVPAGKFSASAIDVRVFDNGQEMKDAHFTLYLSKDSARAPVLLEAVLPVGEARVELTKRGE